MKNNSLVKGNSAGDLKIFLEDISYSPCEYSKKPVLVFKEYEINGEVKLGLIQKGTLRDVFRRTKKELLENLFIQINGGKKYWQERKRKYVKEDEKKYWKEKIEGRKKEDIISYNAFMLDFDLKDENSKHYKGEKLREEKEKLLNQIQSKLPLKADYVIESRNGFHVYYLINPEERKMSSEKWHWIEIGIFNFVRKNITQNVDHAVKKSNQIMRLPYSLHKKDDDNDEGYQVKIIQERKRADKEKYFEQDCYESAMFAYPTSKIIESFKIDDKIITKLKGKGQSLKNIRQSKEYKEIVQTESVKILKSEEILRDKYKVTKAITEENVSYFDYLQKMAPKKLMTREEATKYIKGIDLRKILGFEQQKLGTSFSSLFYTDVHPSDYFFVNPETGLTSYYCRRENKWYNNIFDIVYHLLDFDNKLSEKEKWLKTFNHVYKMFGLKTAVKWEEEFQRTLSNNIEKFNQIVAHSKETKYLKCATRLYSELMTVWKEHVYKNNIDWKTAHRTIAAEWIGKRINLARPTVQKELLLLEYIGLITRIEKKADWYIWSNEYQFNVITEGNFTEIIMRAKTIKRYMEKPLKEVSRKKLDYLFQR